MKLRTLRNLALITAASLGLGACTDGYGYGGVSYGAGYGGYYDDYGYYGSPYYGWYDGWYYPGTGYYIFDNRGTRRRWDDNHRRYWEGRRGDRRYDGDRPLWRPRDRNWQDRNSQDRRDWRRDRRSDSGARQTTPDPAVHPLWGRSRPADRPRQPAPDAAPRSGSDEQPLWRRRAD